MTISEAVRPETCTALGVIAPRVSVIAGVVVAVATVPDTPLAVTTETLVTVPVPPPPAESTRIRPVPWSICPGMTCPALPSISNRAVGTKFWSRGASVKVISLSTPTTEKEEKVPILQSSCEGGGSGKA